MKLKIKLPGTAGQAPAGTSSQAEPSTSTVTPLAQPTAATPSRKRKELSMGGAAADVPEPESYGPPLKRPSIAPPAQPSSASGASMPPPRLKISLPGARAAAAAAAAAASANTPGPPTSAVVPSPRLSASAGTSPASGFGLGPGSASRSAQAGQAPLPSPLTGPASVPRGPAPAAAKGRLSEEARRIAMQVNEAFGTAGGSAATPGKAPDAALLGGIGASSKPGPGPAALPPGPLVAPLPSGEGTTIKKIKLSVKMPNLASLAARIARGEPTGPEDGAGGGGATNAGGGIGAGPAARPVHESGEGPRLGATAPTLVGAAAPVGPPRLPFKVKVRLPSLATGGLSAPPVAAAAGGPGAATTTTIKPLITTTTRPAPTAKATAAAAAEVTDSSDDEDDDYGPDPEFAAPRRGRGRGRGRGPRGAGIVGRGAAVGISRGASVSSVSSIGRSGPAMMPPVGGRGRGRSSDHASRFDLERCFEQIVKQDKDGLFAKPVTDDVAPGYSEVIKDPIDLSVIRERMRDSKYDTWASLEADLLLMTHNAKTYNPPGSTAWWHADLMEKMTLKYVSCGRAGMQNYRGVAASVWRDLRKPAEGASAIPLLPRYTSAGPRLDKNGNERDPAERRRQQQETAAEASSLMLESRLRERRPGPGALRDDVFWPGGVEPRAGVVPAGVGGPLGVLGPGAVGPSGFAASVLGAGPGGPGRRKHRNQGIRMIEADARRLMAAQAGDNRFSYRSKPPASVAPFVLLGGLAAGASPEGLPFAVLRPSLAPATLPCDPPAHAYASSLARFIAKCGKSVQMAALKRLAEPPPPPPPPPPQPVVPLQQTTLDPQSPPQQPAYPPEHPQPPLAAQTQGAGQGQQHQHAAAASWLPNGQQQPPIQHQELQALQSAQGSFPVGGLYAGSPQPPIGVPTGGAGGTILSTSQAPSQQQPVGFAQSVGGQGMTLYPLPAQQQQSQQPLLQQQTHQYSYLQPPPPQQQQQSQEQQVQAPSGEAGVGSPLGGQYYSNPTQQLQQPQQYPHHTLHPQQPQLQQSTAPTQQQQPNAQASNHSQGQPVQTLIQPQQLSSAALAPSQQQQSPYLVPQLQPQGQQHPQLQQPSGPFTPLSGQQYAQPQQQQQHLSYQSQAHLAMSVGSIPMQLGPGPGSMQQQQGVSMHPGPMQSGGSVQPGHVNQPVAFALPSPGMPSYSAHAPG